MSYVLMPVSILVPIIHKLVKQSNSKYPVLNIIRTAFTDIAYTKIIPCVNAETTTGEQIACAKCPGKINCFQIICYPGLQWCEKCILVLQQLSCGGRVLD